MAWQARSQRHAELPSNWQSIRRQVLTRDGHRCTIAGPRCLGTANHVDHTGAPDDHRPEVLRSACQPCHMSRTQQQAQAARRSSQRPAERHPGLLP